MSVSPWSEQLGGQMNFQLLNSSQWWIYIIISADNKKLFRYNYKMLPLTPFIILGHLLVPLFVTVIVSHNWCIVTVVLMLPFSDFLPLSLIQGLFSWTQEIPFKVGGLVALFSLIFETCLHFVTLYYERPRQNVYLQYQHNINHISDESKEKYKFGDN